MTIIRQRSTFPLMLVGMTVFASSPFALAQDPASSKTSSQMTPEQQAEWEAYLEAGTPGEPHKKLAAMTGRYSVVTRSWQEAGGPVIIEETGTATRSMALDGRVLVEHFSGTMMGSPFQGHGMTGYDNAVGQYWSTWNDTTTTGILVSTGTCDAQNACTFTGSWNDPVKKKPVKARTTSRWTDADTEVFELYGPDKQGREMKMMEITYKRM